MSKYNYLAYCDDGGNGLHETLEDALEDADERKQDYLQQEGWREGVESVFVAKITHRAQMCDQVFRDGNVDEYGYDEEGNWWNPDWEYKCNYKVVRVEQNPAPDVAQLVEALERLVLAAQCRDNSTGDQIRLVQTREELSAAAKNAEEALTIYRKRGGDL